MLAFDLDCLDESIYLVAKKTLEKQFKQQFAVELSLDKYRGFPVSAIVDRCIKGSSLTKSKFIKKLGQMLRASYESMTWSECIAVPAHNKFIIHSSLPASSVEFLVTQLKLNPEWVFTGDDLKFDLAGKDLFTPLNLLSGDLIYYTKSSLLFKLAQLNKVKAKKIEANDTLPVES